MERTIDASSGCTTSVAVREITRPCVVTTLSTLMTVIITMMLITIEKIVQETYRANRGVWALTIAVEGD